MFSAEFDEACIDAPDISHDIPIPRGMKLEEASDSRQAKLILSDAYSLRRRRAWGYIGEIKLIASDFTRAGAQSQAVSMFPWRYGRGPEDLSNSFVYARVNCFPSTADFPNPYRAIMIGAAWAVLLKFLRRVAVSRRLQGGVFVPPRIGYLCLAIHPRHLSNYLKMRFTIFPHLALANFRSFRPPNAPYYVVENPTVAKYPQSGHAKKAYADYFNYCFFSRFTEVFS